MQPAETPGGAQSPAEAMTPEMAAALDTQATAILEGKTLPAEIKRQAMKELEALDQEAKDLRAAMACVGKASA